MKLLWANDWIDAPCPTRVDGSTLIAVEATVPIAPLGAAHGRRIEDPLRKVVSFAVTDGPTATLRKARSKRAERAYSGDYHLVAILGRAESSTQATADDTRVVALVPRSPQCASAMLAPDALVRAVGEDFDVESLRALATGIDAQALAPHLSQSYLYSAMAPPRPLLDAFEAALAREASTARKLPAIAVPTAAPTSAAAVTSIAFVGAPATGRGAPLAVLGAGDYVRIEVAPALGGHGLRRAVIADREPQIAALAAAELGFAEASTDALAAIDSLDSRGLVIVATAHDSHAMLAARALERGHRVLCEKPAVVTAADLDRLAAAAEASPGELEIGFNRRHNPLVERARRKIARERGPATIVATIREVDITPDHWYLWPNQGTRVAGNLCHWIDLSLHLLGPGPEPVSVSVSPRVSEDSTGIDAERTFTITFDDGSTVSLVPTGRGDSVRGVQEQIEVRRGQLTIRLDDLWKLRALRSGRPIRRRTLWRDKGHGRMYANALSDFQQGRPAAYPAADVRRVAEVQIAATELLTAELHGGDIAELLTRSRARS